MATITVSDLALELGTDARTTRKFLRSVTPKEDQPGKGSRWAIEKKEIRSLRKKFTAFSEAMRNKAQKPDPVDDDAEISIDAGETDDFEGPTDEELAMLDEIEHGDYED